VETKVTSTVEVSVPSTADFMDSLLDMFLDISDFVSVNLSSQTFVMLFCKRCGVNLAHSCWLEAIHREAVGVVAMCAGNSCLHYFLKEIPVASEMVSSGPDVF
jgi:hypothetical protein